MISHTHTINPLWLGDAIWTHMEIWRHQSSTWNSVDNFTGNDQDIYPWYEFEMEKFDITTAAPRAANELSGCGNMSKNQFWSSVPNPWPTNYTPHNSVFCIFVSQRRFGNSYLNFKESRKKSPLIAWYQSLWHQLLRYAIFWYRMKTSFVANWLRWNTSQMANVRLWRGTCCDICTCHQKLKGICQTRCFTEIDYFSRNPELGIPVNSLIFGDAYKRQQTLNHIVETILEKGICK